MATTDDYNALVIFRVGPVRCCAPSLPVVTVIPPPALTEPPGHSPCRPGIFRYGKRLVSVLDLRLAFGVDPAQRKSPGRIIISELAQGGFTGFWVDDIIEVMETPGRGWGALPPHLPGGIFARTLLLQERIHLYAEFDQLDTLHRPGYLRHYIEQLQAAVAEPPRAQDTAAHGPGPAATQRQASAANTPRSDSPEDPSHNDAPTAEAGLPRDTPDTVPASHRPLKSPPTSAGAETPRRGTPATDTGPKTKSASQAAPATRHPRAGTTDNAGQSSAPSQTVSRSWSKHAEPTAAPPPRPPVHPTADTTNRNRSATLAATAHVSAPVSPTPVDLDTDNGARGGIILVLGVLALIIGGGGYWLYALLSEPVGQKDYLTRPEPSPNHARVGEANAPADAVSPTGTTRPPPRPESLDTGRNHSDETPRQSRPPATVVAKASGRRPRAEDTNPSRSPTPPEERTVSESRRETVQISRHSNTGANPDSPSGDNGVASQSATGEATPTPQARARIQRDTRGITIILETDSDSPVFRSPPETEASLTLTQVPPLTDLPHIALPSQAQAQLPDTEGPQNETTATPAARQATTQAETTASVVHVVVKGDTLWDIAARYVNDPFRYPELARLSDIDNPHLIYPGDRVRIIARQRTPATSEP